MSHEPRRPADDHVELPVPAVASVDRADAALVVAYAEHHAVVYGFLRRATRHDTATEDLLQETFLRLLGELRAGRTPEHVRAWLFRVASNLVISRARRSATVRRWVERQGHDEARAPTEESPESGALRLERTQGLEAALAVLPADARLALLLSSEGFHGTEIATAIGRTDVATRALLHRARIRVRRELEAREASR